MKKKKEETFANKIKLFPKQITIEEMNKGKTPLPPITLKTKGTAEDWRRLAEFIKKDPDKFLREFSDQITNAISSLPPTPYKKNSYEAAFYEACKNGREPKPRGKHKKTGWIEKGIKSGAGQLYSLFSYYYKKPNEQPEYFKKLKDIAEKNGYFPKACKDKILLTGLVIYCIEKTDGAWLKSRGMREIDKDKHNSFYNTYIVNNDYIKFYKNYPVINDADAILKEHASFLTRASFWQKFQKITP